MLFRSYLFSGLEEKTAAAPGLDIHEEGKKKVLGPLNMVQVITLGSLFLIPLCYVLIMQNQWLDYILLALFTGISITLIRSGSKEDKLQNVSIWKDRMIALIIFMVINISFWACFEQA